MDLSLFGLEQELGLLLQNDVLIATHNNQTAIGVGWQARRARLRAKVLEDVHALKHLLARSAVFDLVLKLFTNSIILSRVLQS